MATILHLGMEHPNLLWLFVTAIIAFSLGAFVGMSVSSNESATSKTDETEAIEGR